MDELVISDVKLVMRVGSRTGNEMNSWLTLFMTAYRGEVGSGGGAEERRLDRFAELRWYD